MSAPADAADRRVPAPDLVRLAAEIFRRGGSEPAEAELVAAHLVDANLMGHDSHGIGMVPTYVRHLTAGFLSPNTPAKLVRDDGAILMFDGQAGYGRRVGGEAMAAAIGRCQHTGVVLLTLANAHHVGRVGAYGELAAGAGLVAVLFVNVADHGGLVAPFRGTDARFSTNPVCIALPGTAAHPPLLLDMATSEIAVGKVRVARNTGRPVPEGALVDARGRPTTDPGVMYGEPRGALLAFGRHKGYALAVITELLAGGLSGGFTIQPANPRRGGILNSITGFVVDPARAAGTEWLQREIDGFVSYVKASPPVDPAEPVLVPGDPERAMRAARAREGVPIDAATWGELIEAGETLGLTRAEAEALAAGGGRR